MPCVSYLILCHTSGASSENVCISETQADPIDGEFGKSRIRKKISFTITILWSFSARLMILCEACLKERLQNTMMEMETVETITKMARLKMGQN